MQGWHCTAAGDTGHAWVVIQGQCLGDEAIKLHSQQSAALTKIQRLNCIHAEPILIKSINLCKFWSDVNGAMDASLINVILLR